VVTFNESHLRRLIREYVSYCAKTGIDDRSRKGNPNRRAIEIESSTAVLVSAVAGLGGFHDRYG